MADKLASVGSAGRIGDVHIDVILRVSGPEAQARTSVALESGAPVGNHRQRIPIELSVEIVINDVPPVVGARLAGRWEDLHARKTRNRLRRLLETGETVEFFDGAEFRETPFGTNVWIVDGIASQDDATEISTWRATIRLGEDPRYKASFTALAVDPDVDPSAEDLTDGSVDNGTQSTEPISPEIAAEIPVN